MAKQHSKKIRGNWKGFSCMDKQVLQILRQKGPFREDQSAADFFGVAPSDVRGVYGALGRLVAEEEAIKREIKPAGVAVYSA